jgi:tetratricopeptide (TPR) repeat protein
MATRQEPVRADPTATLPDPGRARTVDDLVDALRSLKIWAGDPSYESIKRRVNASWAAEGRPAGDLAAKTTVLDCFRIGRRRLDPDLVLAIVRALHPDVAYATQWRQALRVVTGQTRAGAQVRVQDTLPPDVAHFTGRVAELDRLRRARRDSAHDGGAVVIVAITGMAGVGKTQLAVHAGHLLTRERPFDRILFVNLRGFHPDQAQPPAEPSAVLDGFLRLLGVPAQLIPHDPGARAAAYRDLLVGTHTLVVLDNAASEEQVSSLLPGTPGCFTLVTSRRHLATLPRAVHLPVDVFTRDEAVAFLAQATPEVRLGHDSDPRARIVQRCGYLPLALGLLTAHIRATPQWTLTDHADRLDERHHDQRVDSGVGLALDQSYQHLSSSQQRLLRLLALQPGTDIDRYAAAALVDTDLATVQAELDRLGQDNMLQYAAERYSLHDLVRGYAIGRASDEDAPRQRREALTRLFDYYLATAAAAMDSLYPAEVRRRPSIPPPGTPTPDLTGADAARSWLDNERHALVAAAVYTADRGWPTHTTRLSTVLFRYLNLGYHSEALIVHDYARRAAEDTDDPGVQAHALTGLAVTYLWWTQYEPAAEHLQQALRLYRQTGDQVGQARALGNLGIIENRRGRYRDATSHHTQALALFQRIGDRAGEARALQNLGHLNAQQGHYDSAVNHHTRALTLFREVKDQDGEAIALNGLADVEIQQGRHHHAVAHIEQALHLFRQLGDDDGEAWALDSFGVVHTRRGRPDQAIEHHRRAMAIFRRVGDRAALASALNGLGEAAHTAGRPSQALTRHTRALAIAVETGSPAQQARAHAGLGHAYRALASPAQSRRHYQHARDLCDELGLPQVDLPAPEDS